ncbi:MAG: hypothetical protein OXQ29_00460 [Rhodospirillaceae bacterium]|nr:hypothetical protein [Rhodospirillaceae bacterium]
MNGQRQPLSKRAAIGKHSVPEVRSDPSLERRYGGQAGLQKLKRRRLHEAYALNSIRSGHRGTAEKSKSPDVFDESHLE